MSVAYTVLRCDAGPVVVQQEVQISQDEQAPELTQRLFMLGSKLLVGVLPGILHGHVTSGTPQDESLATHAPKVRPVRGGRPVQGGKIDPVLHDWNCSHFRMLHLLSCSHLVMSH